MTFLKLLVIVAVIALFIYVCFQGGCGSASGAEIPNAWVPVGIYPTAHKTQFFADLDANLRDDFVKWVRSLTDPKADGKWEIRLIESEGLLSVEAFKTNEVLPYLSFVFKVSPNRQNPKATTEELKKRVLKQLQKISGKNIKAHSPPGNAHF